MFRTHLSTAARCFSLLAVLASSSSANELPTACLTPETLLPSDAHRRVEGLVGESHCYRLDLASAGLASFDLMVSGSLPAGAHFEIYGADGLKAQSSSRRRRAEVGAFGLLDRSAESQLGIIEAGTYFLEVVGDDPRRPLPAYRLQTSLVELSKSETDGELELEPETLSAGGFRCKSETDGELELEPETLSAGGFRCKSETDGELELEPETSKSARDLAAIAGRLLCASGEGDDHGDTRACATPIEHRADGELGNGWGDDADVFRFTVRSWQTVEISTEGDVDTFGTLYDRFGQRLAVAGDGAEGGNFQVVRTLRPGVYFVRVEGEHSSGTFGLRIRTLDR